MIKNNDISTNSKFMIEEGFYILRFENNSSKTICQSHDIDSTYIQFHFCLKGNVDFLFNKDSYSFKVPEGNSILLYNPIRSLPIKLNLIKTHGL